MPCCSSCVLLEWHDGHRDWNRLKVNACSPICCQGKMWSTCSADLIIPSALHPAHIGYWLNCICLSVRHCLVLYLSVASLRFSVWLYRAWLNVSRPPCSVHRLLNLALVFLHPSVLHFWLVGTVGIYRYRTSAVRFDCATLDNDAVKLFIIIKYSCVL